MKFIPSISLFICVKMFSIWVYIYSASCHFTYLKLFSAIYTLFLLHCYCQELIINFLPTKSIFFSYKSNEFISLNRLSILSQYRMLIINLKVMIVENTSIKFIIRCIVVICITISTHHCSRQACS